MDQEAKKTALRMIPYGLFVLTARSDTPVGGHNMSAATINWLTQASFAPPLIVVAVKTDSVSHALVEQSKEFVLNAVPKDGKDMAYAFFKHTEIEGNKMGGETFTMGSVVKAPVLERSPAHLECRVVDTIKRGDHSVFVAEVVEARVKTPPAGRADDAVLWLRDLGEKVFYGG
jgi:flavin reductase (DIM6/NTAB) family NADH-FMN oxidoreductase RutF